MTRPVRHLMAEGAVIGIGILEALERRHLHMVRTRGVIGAPAAVTDVRAAVPEEGVDARDPFVGIDVLNFGFAVAIRQAVDLIDVEDGVGLEERDALFDALAGLVGVLANDLACIDHRRTPLALADVGAERQRLAEGHPG